MIEWGQRLDCLKWAEQRLGQSFDLAKVVWLTSVGQDGSIRGVVVFSNFTKTGMEVSVAGEGGQWITKKFALAVAGYVFYQCEAKRATAIIAAGNEKSLNLAVRLGFRVEGHLRDWFPTGDAKILGLLREDCKFLRILDGLAKPAAVA